MKPRRAWQPLCCSSCGEPLEEWRWPLEPDAYVPCYPCGRWFVVEDGELVPCVLSLEPPEIRRVFDELLAVWFESRERQPSPETRAAA